MNAKKCLLLVPFLFLLCLTACHGAREYDPFEVPAQFDMTRTYEISFWAKNDTNKAQTRIYEEAISDFEALYPNIKVNLRLYTDYGKIYNDVITNIATQTTPNVCVTYPDHIATYLSSRNAVVPLDDLMEDAKYGLGGTDLPYDGPSKEDMIPQFMQECQINGITYAVPYMRSTEACYINKTYVEKLGYSLPDILTWDFIWEVADAAAQQNEDGTYRLNGQRTMIPFIYKSTDNMMIQMLRQKGAGYSTPAGEIEIFHEETKDLLFTIAKHVETGAFSTFKISSYPANFLNAGQCVFAIDSTAGATWMGTNAPLSDISPDKLVEFETAVRPIPQFDPAHPQMISQGPSICVFNQKDPQEVLASWLFVQFLLTNDVQIAYAQTEGYVPVTAKAQKAAAYQEYLSRCGEDNQSYYDVKIKASQMLLSNIHHTFVTPVFNGSASLRDAAGQMIESTAKSVKRHEQIDADYFDSLFQNVTSLYRLDQIGTAGAMNGREDLGPMPAASIALLSGLGFVWIVITVCAFFSIWRKKQKNRT